MTKKIIKNEPLQNIEWIHIRELQYNDYNPNHVYNNEMKLLYQNILRHGWLQPILINKENIIIDGFHRVTLMKQNRKLYNKTSGYVPCIILDIDADEAKLTTIRMNRAKGTHTAYKMSNIIHELHQKGYTREYLAKSIGANIEEINLLLEDNVFTHHKIDDNTKYSQAWTPK